MLQMTNRTENKQRDVGRGEEKEWLLKGGLSVDINRDQTMRTRH